MRLLLSLSVCHHVVGKAANLLSYNVPCLIAYLPTLFTTWNTLLPEHYFRIQEMSVLPFEKIEMFV